MGGESGQATLEWVGLVLLAALVLGGLGMLAAGRAPAEGRELGEELAERFAAAAARSGGGSVAAPPAVRRQPAGPVSRPRGAGASASRPRGAGDPVGRPRGAGVLDRLGRVGSLAKHAWIVCLGYHRWRYELENPRVWNEPFPIGEAVKAANSCLNPYAFLTED
jgi:hypothetical protein